MPFFGFVILAFAVAAAASVAGARVRPRLLNLFLAYTLIVSFAAGLTQRDAWPFSTWPLVAGIHPDYAMLPRALVVDRAGGEHDVDYRAWRPLVVEELLAWMRSRMLTLPRADQDRAAEHLLMLVERTIEDLRRGDSLDWRSGWWGPLNAPYFLLHPVLWRSAADAPAERLIGIRLYLERWNLEERLRDPSAVQRTLLYEYRRP